MNRGSLEIVRKDNPISVRFNEAPIHESGKFAESARPASSRTGFNEAPIHESGKFRAELFRRRVRYSFNEAPIHESGKCSHRGRPNVLQTSASMRPRFMNRGSYSGVARVSHCDLASMRPRFMNRGS